MATDAGGPGIDPPDTPLGMLQRGRGAGVRWALSAPRDEARAALLRCILEDPRRDRQLDAFEGAYADLVEALELDLAPVAAHLDGPGRDPDPRRAREAVDLPVSVLVRLSAGGGPRAAEATALLRAYVERGAAWESVLEEWADARPPAGALEAMRAAAVARTGGAALRSRVAAAMERAAAGADGGTGPVGAPAAPPGSAPGTASSWWDAPLPEFDPSTTSTIELLDLAATSPRRDTPAAVADALRGRTSADDLATLRAAARDTAEPRRCARALQALAARGECVATEAAVLMETDLRARRCAWVRAQAISAACAVPPAASLPLARDWLRAGGLHRRDLAEFLLGVHAEPADFPLLAALVESLADGPCVGDDCPCRVLEALARTGGVAARPLLERTFRGTVCSLARARAAERLRDLPGGLPADLAVESLWDAQASVVGVALPLAPLDAPGVRERLRRIAAGLDAELAAAATARLATA